MFFLQIPSNISLDAYAAVLVDQYVDYACATNERGQYCAVAQLENLTDVQAESPLFIYYIYVLLL